jgi:acyl-coenzyme A thioesterase PaaI-like protein
MDVMMAAPHSTVEMNASFLAACRPGDRLLVEGRVLRLGRTIAFGEAEAHRGGELVAKGRMTFVIRPAGRKADG